MGLFNKILETVDLAKEKIQCAINGETMSNEEHPLADETVKKYYEIIYGLLASVWLDRTKLPTKVQYKGIKKYVEHFIDEKCDEEKLQKALFYFEHDHYDYKPIETLYSLYFDEDGMFFRCTSSRAEINISKFAAKKIMEMNSILEEDTTYRCATKEEAFEICYNISGVLNKVKAQYEEILVNIENNIGTFRKDIKELVDNCVKAYRDALQSDTIKDYIRNVTRDKFFESDSNVRFLSICSVYSSLSYDYHIASIALRTVHFEKYGNNEKDYTSFTDDECRKLVTSEDIFMGELNKFADEDETNRYINEKIQSIKKTDMLYSNIANFWMPNKEDMYYADKVCYEFWTDVANKNDMDFAQDISTVFNTIRKYKTK